MTMTPVGGWLSPVTLTPAAADPPTHGPLCRGRWTRDRPVAERAVHVDVEGSCARVVDAGHEVPGVQRAHGLAVGLDESSGAGDADGTGPRAGVGAALAM